MRTTFSLLGSLDLRPHIGSCSRFDSINVIGMFFSVLASLAGGCACPSSALAEVEEPAIGQAVGNSYYMQTLARSIVTDLFIGDDTDGDVDGIDNSTPPHGLYDTVTHGNAAIFSGSASYSLKSQNNFDGARIPEAVWSLNPSASIDLDEFTIATGLYIHIGRNSHVEFNVSEHSRDFLPWNLVLKEEIPSVLASPPQFQVASCGGNGPERRNLEHCADSTILSDYQNDISNRFGQQNATTQADIGNSPVLSDSSSTVTVQPNASDVISSIIPEFAWNKSVRHFASCAHRASFCINSGESSTDLIPSGEDSSDKSPSFSTPNDDLTVPIDTYPVILTPPLLAGGGLGSDPPPTKAIPETSTWVMTVIGFVIVTIMLRYKTALRVRNV